MSSNALAAPTFWQRARAHPGFVAGAVLTLCLLLGAALSYGWTPYSVYGVAMDAKLQPPSAQHWLGTDAYGRDVVSLLLVGARASILVGVVAVGIGLVVGTALGLLASARRGWVEELVMRVADFGFAFPAILTAIMLTAAYGPGIGNAIAAIGIYNIPAFARITRAAANAVWPSFYGEMFSTKVRFSGMAIGTQLGFLMAGFAPSIVAGLGGVREGGWVVISAFTAVICLIAAVSALTARETKDVPTSQLGQRSGAPVGI